MKQLAQYQDGRLELQDVPSPMPPPGGILVRVTHSVISPGTEKMKVEQARMSLLQKAKARPDQVKKVIDTARTLGWKSALEKVRNRLESPTPLGYSAAGVVVAVDPLNTRFSVGQRVACGGAECAFHAEMIAVPDLLAAPIPDGVEDWQAAYTTLASISMEGVRQSGARLGERVIVMGQGLVGLLATSLLKASGARVMGVDYVSSRLETARAMGAERVVNPSQSKLEDEVRAWTDGYGADAVLLCVGGKGASAADTAIACLRDRGVIVIVGIYDAELSWKTAYMKDIQVRYSRSYGPGRYDPQYEWGGRDYPIGHVRWTENRNFESSLELMRSGGLNLTPVTTRRAKFSDSITVYDELMQQGNADIGVVLEYNNERTIDAKTNSNQNKPNEDPEVSTDHRGSRLDEAEALESAADDFRRDSSSVRAQQASETLRGRTDQIAAGYEALKGKLSRFDERRLAAAVDAGGEHEVFEAGDVAGRVYKITRPNFSGLSIIAMTLMNGEARVTMDDATPPEYLERMVYHNHVFADDIRLEGLHQSQSGVHLVISQPLINGSKPEAEAVTAYLDALGFKKTNDCYHWYRAADDIALGDTKPANFIQEPDGTVHAVDVIVFRPSDVMMKCWGLTRPPLPDEVARIEGLASATKVAPPSSISHFPSSARPASLSVIGAGNFARTMLLPHLKDKIALGTIVNATGLSARHVKEKFGFADAETDADKVFASEGQAVMIGTRHHLHAPMVLKALKANQHVFVEKPLCLTREELSEIDAAMATTKGSVMVGFNRRYAPATLDLKKALAGISAPKTLAFHVCAGPLAPDHWYANLDESGGRVLGEACHFLDFACFVLGAKPVNVAAQTVWPARGRNAFPDSVTAQVAFSDGSSFQLVYTAEGDSAFPKETFRLFTSGLVADCENFQRLSLFQKRKETVKKYSSKGHAEEMAAWLAFLKDGAPHPLPYAETQQSMDLTFAVLESIRNGSEQRL